MIRIAICDDIPIISQGMKEILLKHNFDVKIEIDTFTSGENLFKSTVEKRYNIILIDIELYPTKESDENGMTISNRIKDIYPEVIVIFFTGNVSYKNDLLNFEPFRFIEKPVKNNKLIESVNAAIRRVKHWDKYFNFYSNRILHRIKLNRILYFESRRPYIEVECIDGHMCFRGKLDDVENTINSMVDDFLRANKSYLINQEYMKSYRNKEVMMLNGEKISISRNYANEFAKKLFELDLRDANMYD